MSDVIIYDLTTNNVLRYMRSVHTPDYQGNPDVLINPIIPRDVPLYYLTVDTGLVREMTAVEKEVVDTARAPTPQKMRSREYPNIAELIDMLYKSMDSGEISKSVEFYDAVKRIQDTYPDKV